MSRFQPRKCGAWMFGLSLGVGLLLSFFILLFQSVLADDSPDEDQADSKALKALEKVFDELDKHAEQFDGLKKRQASIQSVFDSTEQAVSQIQVRSFQKQLQAMNSAVASEQIFREFERNRSQNDQGGTGGNNRRDLNTEAFLIRQKSAADFDVMMKSNEVLQLNAELQSALKRRVDAFNDLLKLEQDHFAWKTDANEKQEELTEHLDLDGSRSQELNQMVLELVQQRGTKYALAQVLQGLVSLRLGLNAEASKSFDEAIELNPSLGAVAMAGKALVAVQRDDKKKGKPEIAGAIKQDKKNPIVLAFQAIWAADQQEFPLAGKACENLAKQTDYEISALRLSVLIAATKPKLVSRDTKEMLENADKALKLSGPNDWLSQITLAIAFKESNKKDEAIAAANKAMELTSKSNLDRCKEVLESIDESKPIKWPLLFQK